MKSKPCLPSRTAIYVLIAACIKITRAAGILLLLCLFDVAANAQQPHQTYIDFELSIDDLSSWTQTNKKSASLSIEVRNINRPSESVKKISLITESNLPESESDTHSVKVIEGQSYPLVQNLNTHFDFTQLQGPYDSLSFGYPRSLMITEMSWPNDTGIIVFKSDDREQVSAFISLSLEPATYQIRAQVNDGSKIIQIANLTEGFAENKSRRIHLKAPTLFGSIWNKLISFEGLLGTIIVALATILVGVLKEKIKTAFNWVLDFLGKYFGGKLAERRFFHRYIENLSFNHKYLKLIGFNTAGISRPLLEEVFVSLRIASSSLPVGMSENKESQDTSTISFNSAFKQYKYMVILGGPGAGKTTTLSYALLMFGQKKGFEKFSIEEDLLPIYIPLRRLSNTNRSIVEDLTDKDTQILSAEILKEYPVNYFERKLKKGQCLVLLDGLDEVIDEKTHRQVAERINSLVAAYPDNRFVVTCRIAGWKDLLSGEFKVLLAQDFNREEIQHFVLGWHKAVITQSENSRLQLDIPDKKKFEEAWESRKEQFVKPAIEIQSRKLLRAIDSNNRILAIAVNPMLLSLISLVHFNRQYLPRGRTVLYSQCIELLIDSWDRTRDILSIGTKITSIQKEAVLREIAFNFQVNGKGEDSRDKLEQLIEEIARKLGISMPAKELLEDIEMRSGLLVERSIDVFGFSHLTLQEYLVAKHIQLSQSHYELLTTNFDAQEWREVILLYTGLVDDATELIKGVAAADSLERQILAGYCIGDAQHCDSRVSEEIINRLLCDLSNNADRTDEIINVMSAIATDFQAEAVSVEDKLSEKLIETITDEGAITKDRLNAIAILGRARVTHALPSLIYLMDCADEAIREECIKAIILFGNLALPALENHPLWSSLKVSDPKDTQSIIEVLSGINTGQSARLLIELYDLNEDGVDMQISYRLSQMLTNTFVEADLLEIEANQLPRSLKRIPIDRQGWSYKSVKSGFWLIDTKLRNDIHRIIHYISLGAEDIKTASPESASICGISFKVLFPAFLSYLRNLPRNHLNSEGNKDSGYKFNIFEKLGFDETDPNKIYYLVNQINKSFEIPLDLALQNIRGRKTSDYSYQTTKHVKWLVRISDIYFLMFLFLSLNLTIYAIISFIQSLAGPPFSRTLPAVITVAFVSPLFFYLVLTLITKSKLKKDFLTKRFFSLVAFPITNFLKVLPYLTKQKPWLKLITFQFLVLCFSHAGMYTFAVVYSAFSSQIRPRTTWDALMFAFFPAILFLLLSSLYWKYYVLSQNPVVQLILMHPQGRKIAAENK